jgi:site-specific DNA-cytosine methylase
MPSRNSRRKKKYWKRSGSRSKRSSRNSNKLRGRGSTKSFKNSPAKSSPKRAFKKNMTRLRYVSLFSGIGGFEVGIHKVYSNAKCMGFSEVNPKSIKVYKEHFPDHPELGDIRKITEEDLEPLKGKIDLLVGGSPCQNFSLAGDRTGLKGEKSSLLHEYIRIKDILQPTHFILENVVMSPEHQEQVSYLLGVEPVMINSGIASYQQRKRLYWCDFDISKLAKLPHLSGTVKNILLAKNDDLAKAMPHKNLTRSRGSMENRMKSILRGKPLPQSGWFKMIKYTDKSVRTILKGDACYEWVVIDGMRIRQIHPIERERLQTFDDDWTSSLSRTARYEVLGDAVTCDVIALIVAQIK